MCGNIDFRQSHLHIQAVCVLPACSYKGCIHVLYSTYKAGLDPLPPPAPTAYRVLGTGMEGEGVHIYIKITKRDFELEEATGHIAASIYREQFI
jgi:hypothetical protein